MTPATELAITEAAPGLELTERLRLERLERVIERGLTTFVEVGQALTEIRDDRLYHATHASFEDYCRDRWGFRRAHAHRLIQSAKVLQALSPTGDTPASERQARELTPLLGQQEQLRAAWSDAKERASNAGSPLTSRLLRTAVRHRLPRAGIGHEHIGTDRWETPTDLFTVLDQEFRFELDVCALPANAKCVRFFTPDQDGLKQPWLGRCWMNPPYNGIRDWLAKASLSVKRGATVVALLPVHTDAGWWWDYCRDAEIRFLRGRLRFSNAPTAAPFASAVVVFGYPARVVWWNWRPAGRQGRNK